MRVECSEVEFSGDQEDDRADGRQPAIATRRALGRQIGEQGVEIGHPSWQRFGGKAMIDATKPPTYDPEARDLFERIQPIGRGEIKLEDYL